MPKLIDLTNRRFGRLVVVGLVRRDRNPSGRSKPVWSCACDCGRMLEYYSIDLLSGHATSCPCTNPLYKHGKAKTSTYRIWTNMHTRCGNPKATQYTHYGARGIKVCDRWRDFSHFLQDMGERPSPKHSLDRYPDQNGNYEPGNVRWATQTEQCRNRRCTRAVIRSDGVIYRSMGDAADAVGGCHKGIHSVCSGRNKTHRGFGWRYA